MRKDIPQGNATYDAATTNMGSPWKMPTYNQCEELINEAVSGWATVNGVNGRKFFNNIDSANYIFIPASGMWNATRLESLNDIYKFWCTKWYDSYSGYAMGSSKNGIGGTSRQFGYYGSSVRAIQLSKSNFSKSKKSNEQTFTNYCSSYQANINALCIVILCCCLVCWSHHSHDYVCNLCDS